MNVGSILPAGVAVAPLPKAVVKVLGQYKGYVGVLSGRTLVIVDPTSRAISYLLPLGLVANGDCPR